MRRPSLRLLGPLALPFLAAWSPGADGIAFRVEPGSSLGKTYETRFEMGLDDFRLSVEGQDVDPSMMGNPEVHLKGSQTIAVSDQYVAIAGARPDKLRRVYESLAGTLNFTASAEGESVDQDIETPSELDGKAVVFEWNAKDDKFDVHFDEGSAGEEALLADLVEDMDLRTLLPGGPVSTGDSWDVDPKSLVHLLSPGGNLGFVPEGGDSAEGREFLEQLDLDTAELLADLLRGSVKATYVGQSSVDGRDLAQIELAIDIASQNDLSSLLDKIVDAAKRSSEEGMDVDVSFESTDLTLTMKGKGTLLWDLSGGHAHSLEAAVEHTVAVAVEVSADVRGESQSASFSCELSGSSSVSLETTR